MVTTYFKWMGISLVALIDSGKWKSEKSLDTVQSQVHTLALYVLGFYLGQTRIFKVS